MAASADVLFHNEEMLHAEPPADLLRGDVCDGGVPSACRTEPIRRALHIADGGGQSDPAGRYAGSLAKSGKLTEDLVAAVGAGQGVDFVDDDVAEIPEDAHEVAVAVDEHSLQRFRCDLQYPARVFHEPVLLGRGDVSVPVRDGDTGLVAQFGNAAELVVDEGFEGGDIDDPDGLRHIVVELRENGKERRLGFPGRGLGGQQESEREYRRRRPEFR